MTNVVSKNSGAIHSLITAATGKGKDTYKELRAANVCSKRSPYFVNFLSL